MKLDHHCELRKDTDNIFPVILPGSSPWAYVKRRLQKHLVISSTNPCSKLYLRSKAGIDFEKRRHARSITWYVIHPFSKMRSSWEVVMVIALIMAFIMIPFKSAYGKQDVRAITMYYIKILDLICGFICLIDVGLNFITGYHNPCTKEIVLDPARIARKYLKGYFAIDFISSLPLNFLIEETLGRDIVGFAIDYTLINCIGFLKLLRIRTLIDYINNFFILMDLDYKNMQLCRLALIVFLSLHWFACLHFLIPVLVHGDEIYENPSGEPLSWIHIVKIQYETARVQYLHSLFRASCNIMFLDYAQGSPKTLEDTLTLIFGTFIGAVLYIYYFVVLIHVLLSEKVSEMKYQEMMTQLKEYMRHKKVPRHLQMRLITLYEYTFQHQYFRETAIHATLSAHLRKELILNSCQHLVQNTPLLINVPKPIINSIVSCLRCEIYLPNDIIVKHGDHGDCMYFIISGSVIVLTPTGKEMYHLQDNSFFGEAAVVLEDDRRSSSVVAVEICELYLLNRHDLKRIISPYPDLFTRIVRIAIQRVEETLRAEEEYKRVLVEQGMRQQF